MKMVIKKWGNSPAVRLNSTVMKTASFDLEQRVTIKASKGCIIIESADRFDCDIKALVSGISRKNLHGETDFGQFVGKELPSVS